MVRCGIVVVAYNNYLGLKRLLFSLSRANYSQEVCLVISIDKGGEERIAELAKSFDWKYGNKEVIQYPENLGLRAHILKCGDYMEKYDWDAEIVLEDDIIVSPYFYSFAQQTIEKYGTDKRIAGISLYKHEFNNFAKQPFTPLDSNSDVFFLQYAQSWGQIWLKTQWREFIEWYNEKKYEELDLTQVPANVLTWDRSWLKYHIMYLIDTNTYFVYPRVSYTSNCSDAGEHNKKSNAKMQVPMCRRERKLLVLPDIDSIDSIKYDAFFENVDLVSFLPELNSDLCVDLYGVKPISKDKHRYLLSTKILNKKIIDSYDMSLRPREENVYHGVKGNVIFLYDMTVDAPKPKYNGNTIFEYNLKGINCFTKQGLHFLLYDFFERVKIFCKMAKKKIKKATNK